jgi:arylsulfatase A-like enzyme
MNRLTRRDFMKTAALASAAGMIPFSACRGRKQPPSILLIMADDVGSEVPGCYGGTTYSTPNIDKLAQGGVRFTHCYSTPKCAPSRVKLMTGRYQFRTTEEWGYIPPEERTFGHVLSGAGYATALAGKWQMTLLKSDPGHVRKMGFQESCVFGWHEGPRYHQPFIYQNGRILEGVEDRYGPDIYCDFLIDFMEKNRDRPFLAYYPMAVAHEVSNDFTPPPPPGPDGRYQSYRELIEVMDANVGRLVDALDRLGLRENTIILFTTDNGTPKEFLTEIRNGEYIDTPIVSVWQGREVRGGKGELTDAGTRVPFIANGPGRVPSGEVCNDPIDFSDFMPTLAELAGADLPREVKIDGRSFAPQLLGKQGNPRKWVYNQFEGRAWIRTREWKLYRDGLLFDMKNDPEEKNPIRPGSDSDHSAEMRKKLEGWLKGLDEG